MRRISKQDSRFDSYLSTFVERFNSSEAKAESIRKVIDDYLHGTTKVLGLRPNWPSGVLRRKRVSAVRARLQSYRLQAYMVKIAGPHWGLPRDATIMRLRMNWTSGVSLNALPRRQHTHQPLQESDCDGCKQLFDPSSRINVTRSKKQANSRETILDHRAPISLTRGKPNGKRVRPREFTRSNFLCRHCGAGLSFETGTHLRLKSKKVCAGKGSI